MMIENKCNANGFRRRQDGMTLLDILLAMVVFAIGMIALASLQGNLSRSSADASVRTVGTNVAEELIEGLRAIEDIETDGTCASDLAAIAADDVYECIVDGAQTTVSRGGVNYAVAADVSDYYLMPDGVTITSNVGDLPEDWSTGISNFKMVELTVTWANDDSVGFQGAPADDILLGSGSFTVSSIIPSIPNIGSAKIAASENEDAGTPPVAYTPGARPDIVQINLDGSKFKESTKPKPDVIRSDYIVETWFDVVTYNQATDGDGNNASTYLRREEFAVVACECTLRGSGTSGFEGGDGFLPTTWNGEEYTEGTWTTKQWGESANNQQSQYCDTCCRDHHDASGAGADTLYRPWTGSEHDHYMPNNQGGYDTAGVGDDYLEVCRMVRKDGFMRVAQDFNMNGLIATRQAFFTDSGNISDYSDHVRASVNDEFGITGSPTNDFSTAMTLPGDSVANAVPLPRADFAEFDQQVSRALYTDHVTNELAATLTCVRNGDDSCAPAGVSTEIEILPFYEIQTTWLSFWEDNVSGSPVFVTNETIADDNTHSRGEAQLTGTDAMMVPADTYIHTGNVGLTSTDPIDGDYDTNIMQYDLQIAVYGGGDGGPGIPNPHGVSGTMSGTGGIKASDAIFTPSAGVYCNHDANSFECVFDGAVVSSPSVTLTGYRKNKDAWVCETNDILADGAIVNTAATGTAVIDLSDFMASKVTTLHLSFQDSGCGI